MGDLGACIVRVCNDKDQTQGSGFVVSEGLAITSAHVVEACGSAPGGRVSVIFHANGEKQQAEVSSEYWGPPEADDIAVLYLLPTDQPLPKGVESAKLGSTRSCQGHRMRTAGYSELPGTYDFSWAEGHLHGLVPSPGKQPMLQINAVPILKGMSGAPILDLITNRVVGLVTEYMPNAPLQWATTAETLKVICPRLTLHPPQAVEDYLTAVGEYCSTLPYLSLSDIPSGKTLDEVYVLLEARPNPPRNEERQRQVTASGNIRGDEHVSVTEVVRDSEEQHIFILGQPGAGKSTLLRQLAANAWKTPNVVGLTHQYLPLLVPLRRFTGTAGSLEERLNNVLTTELLLTHQLPQGFLTDWPEQTGSTWLIMLDALDEVPMDVRPEFMQWLKGIATKIGPNRLIITSRPSDYWYGGLDRKAFREYNLLPFTPEQVHEFATKWFEAKAEHFFGELGRVKVDELRGMPLLLTIAASIYSQTNDLPEQRSALYRQFVNVWLAEAQQGLRAEVGERICNVSRTMLARLAFAMTEQPSHITEAMLYKTATEYLCVTLNYSKDEAEPDAIRLVQTLARRSGIFVRRGRDYDFIHPTFREYLVAEMLVHDCDGDTEKLWHQCVSWWDKWNWHGVVLFALSIINDAELDVIGLLDRIRNQGEEGSFFASDALIGRVTHNQKFQREVEDDLLRLGSGNQIDYETRERAAHQLYALGRRNEATKIWLMLAQDEQASDLVRMDAANWVGMSAQRDTIVEFARTKPGVLVDLELADGLGILLGLGVSSQADVLVALARDEKVSDFLRHEAVSQLRLSNRATELFELARDRNVSGSVREECARALGGLKQVASLRTLWCDKDMPSRIREQCAEALASLGGIDDLIILASDETLSVFVRMRAIDTLAQLGRSPKTMQALLVLMHNERTHEWVRDRSAEALVKLGEVNDLLSLTRDEKANVSARVDAAMKLHGLGLATEAELVLLSLVYGRKVGESSLHEGWYTQQIITALETLGLVDDLRTLIRDQKMPRDTRDCSSEALVRLGGVDDLLSLARDNTAKWSVRVDAAVMLYNLAYRDTAVEMLLSMAKENRALAWDRDQVVAALGKLECVDALSNLVMCEDLDVSLRVQSASWLGKSIHAAEAARILLSLAQSNKIEPWIRNRAAETMNSLDRRDEAAQAWLALARDETLHSAERIIAIDALCRLERMDEALPILLALLRNESSQEDLRVKAAEVLGQFQDRDEAHSVLLTMVRNPALQMIARLRATQSLCRWGYGDEITPFLLFALHDEAGRPWLRVQAAKELGQLGKTTEASTVLLVLSDDERLDSRIRLEAAKTLWNLSHGTDAKRIITRLAEKAMPPINRWEKIDPGFFAALAVALEDVGETRKIEEMFQMLGQDGMFDRQGLIDCIHALEKLGNVDVAVHILLELMRAGTIDQWTRVQAIGILGQMGRFDEMRTLAHDETLGPWMRARVIERLAELGHLDEMLAWAIDKHVDEEEREKFGEILSTHGRLDDATGVLLDLATDRSVKAQVRERAAIALGRKEYSVNATQAWNAIARDENVSWWVRNRAIEVLGQIGTDSVLPDLQCIASEASIPVICQTANRSIEQIRHRAQD